MRLYVDEDCASAQLIARLRQGGHEVIEPLRGEPDVRCWLHAQALSAAVLTMNVRDFVPMASQGEHHGLLLVYRENDPTRDMAARDVAAAVDRAADVYPGGITGQILTLNQFRS